MSVCEFIFNKALKTASASILYNVGGLPRHSAPPISPLPAVPGHKRALHRTKINIEDGEKQESKIWLCSVVGWDDVGARRGLRSSTDVEISNR